MKMIRNATQIGKGVTAIKRLSPGGRPELMQASSRITPATKAAMMYRNWSPSSPRLWPLESSAELVEVCLKYFMKFKVRLDQLKNRRVHLLQRRRT